MRVSGCWGWEVVSVWGGDGWRRVAARAEDWMRTLRECFTVNEGCLAVIDCSRWGAASGATAVTCQFHRELSAVQGFEILEPRTCPGYWVSCNILFHFCFLQWLLLFLLMIIKYQQLPAHKRHRPTQSLTLILDLKPSLFFCKAYGQGV